MDEFELTEALDRTVQEHLAQVSSLLLRLATCRSFDRSVDAGRALGHLGELTQLVGKALDAQSAAAAKVAAVAAQLAELARDLSA